MILVTGAAGKTGRAVLQSLSRKGKEATALVRSQQQADSLGGMGGIDCFIGDLRNPKTFEQAIQKSDVLYYICPNISPDELEIGKSLISICSKYHYKRFVFHSVLHPQIKAMPHHWQKMSMEDAIFESGIEYTILQPCAYMQNVLTGWQKIIKGEYIVPYQVQSPISMVDLEDVGEVAATILSEKGYGNAIFELAGPEALTQVEAARQMSEVLGYPIRAVEQSRAEWKKIVHLSGMVDTQIEVLLKMFEYYDKFGLVGNPITLERLLGRGPTTFNP